MAMKRIPPSTVSVWSDARLREAWEELRAQVILAGWQNEGDLPAIHRWNYHVLQTEIALRYAQGSLF